MLNQKGAILMGDMIYLYQVRGNSVKVGTVNAPCPLLCNQNVGQWTQHCPTHHPCSRDYLLGDYFQGKSLLNSNVQGFSNKRYTSPASAHQASNQIFFSALSNEILTAITSRNTYIEGQIKAMKNLDTTIGRKGCYLGLNWLR